ncbi:MAG: hypothetical protein SFW09_08335 [Hyphomicrobiaceae bacterium]|nr:hypothetical protein [Hyphomicrobiaceae bacterium]
MGGRARLPIEEMRARARAAGLTLSEAQLVEIHKGYGHIEDMVERVKRGDQRSREAEPELVFRARLEG